MRRAVAWKTVVPGTMWRARDGYEITRAVDTGRFLIWLGGMRLGDSAKLRAAKLMVQRREDERDAALTRKPVVFAQAIGA